MDNKYVDCNDQGVEYLNVQINCPMSQVLNNPYVEALDVVFPQDLPWNTTSLDRSALVVQLTHFNCGGLAVSVCISHKIADGYSIGQFLKDWASTTRDDQLDFKPSPWFGANSLFPSKLDDPPIVNGITREPQRLSKAYHFSSSNLGRLKDMVVATNSGVVHNPTSIEVATALVHKCAVVSSSTLLSTDENHPPTTTSMFKPSLLWQVMNLRPPLPLNAIGNGTYYFTAIATSEDEIQVPNFVDQLGKAKQHVKDKLKEINVNELGSRALEESKVAKNIMADDDYYLCSSFRNFGLYTIDFGWGRPIRVVPASHPRKKTLHFLDDPNGDGINENHCFGKNLHTVYVGKYRRQYLVSSELLERSSVRVIRGIGGVLLLLMWSNYDDMNSVGWVLEEKKIWWSGGGVGVGVGGVGEDDSGVGGINSC
ncbi:acylsugar acyltransferase 3-like [Solanum dulcamara]|uniref:acylsugar acyltransferase 3-like n=1 Tax=Solanum dulcamara TaxID=45834 RepID=UPI0024867E64|nr:acylsugar acyltransferase 3-like [Solanum dulcamara]